MHLLKEESVKDLYRLRLDQELEEFHFEKIEGTYKHIKRCIEGTTEEALGQEEGGKGRYEQKNLSNIRRHKKTGKSNDRRTER